MTANRSWIIFGELPSVTLVVEFFGVAISSLLVILSEKSRSTVDGKWKSLVSISLRKRIWI